MGLQLPGALVTLLQDLGYNWPEADEEKLYDLGSMWMDFAPRLQPLADQVESGAQRVWTDNHGDAVDAFKAKWSAGDAPLASLKDSVTGAEMVGPLLMVIDWLFAPGRRRLEWKVIWTIVVFPLVWAVYTMIRGPLAYNDVFLIIAILAFLLFLWGVAIELKMRRRGDISPIIQFAQAMTAKLGAAAQVKDAARE